MSIYCTVLCTAPNLDIARILATTCIEKKLAACVNMIPKIESIYEWQEKIETSKEVLLIFKTSIEKYSELEQEIIAKHPYEVPEILQIPIQNGYTPYLDWIDANLR